MGIAKNPDFVNHQIFENEDCRRFYSFNSRHPKW